MTIFSASKEMATEFQQPGDISLYSVEPCSSKLTKLVMFLRSQSSALCGEVLPCTYTHFTRKLDLKNAHPSNATELVPSQQLEITEIISIKTMCNVHRRSEP